MLYAAVEIRVEFSFLIDSQTSAGTAKISCLTIGIALD